MHGNCVKVVCVSFWLFFGTHVLVDSRSIRQVPNSALNTSAEYIYGDENGEGSADIVLIDETILVISNTETEAKMVKRDLPLAETSGKCKSKKCNNQNSHTFGANEDDSFEMAESHIFRPLFRYRVRKSSNARSFN